MTIEVKKDFNFMGFSTCLFIDQDVKFDKIDKSKGDMIAAIDLDKIIILAEFENYRTIIEEKIKDSSIDYFTLELN